MVCGEVFYVCGGGGRVGVNSVVFYVGVLFVCVMNEC